jgi:anti-anti-sigma factor
MRSPLWPKNEEIVVIPLDAHTTVVICQGEKETLAAEGLHQAVDPLLGDGAVHPVFDLAAVEYVSSSVLSFLMSRQASVQETNGKVSLVGASELVRQVFEMAALDSLFTVYRVSAQPHKYAELGIFMALSRNPVYLRTNPVPRFTRASELPVSSN